MTPATSTPQCTGGPTSTTPSRARSASRRPPELGTLYSLDELRALTEEARRNGLRVHMDGARFANAIAALGVTPKEITWKAGVDVLCFGGSKNGIAAGRGRRVL